MTLHSSSTVVYLKVTVPSRADADAGVEVRPVGLAPRQHLEVSHLRREPAGLRVPGAVVLAGVPQRVQVALEDGGGARRLVPRAPLSIRELMVWVRRK